MHPTRAAQGSNVMGLIVCLWLQLAHAQHAYVGVADVGRGRGALGHVFLVLAGADDEISGATAYQFAIDVPPEYRLGARAFNDLARFPFTLAKVPAREIIDGYTAEDRAVVLYHLRIGRADVENIRAAADAEHERRARSAPRDFRIDHNCATATFDLIELGLGASRFAHASPLNLLVHAPADAAAWMSIPLTAMPRLRRHPLVDRSRTFEPVSVGWLRTALAAMTDLEILFDRCGTSAPARSLVARAFAQPALRTSPAYLDGLRGLLATCAQAERMTGVYNDHLDVLNLFATSAEERARIEHEYL